MPFVPATLLSDLCIVHACTDLYGDARPHALYAATAPVNVTVPGRACDLTAVDVIVTVPLLPVRIWQFDIRALSALIVRIQGHVLRYIRLTSSLLYPYVFVAGPIKHAPFRPS